MVAKYSRLKSTDISYFSKALNKGFTLIEMIIGLLVFAIALSLVTTLLIPAEENSADQVHQVKAAQLAKALLNDILSHSFDENSDRDGGIYRCNEDKDLSLKGIDLTVDTEADIDLVTERCHFPADFGVHDANENSRSDFDDVDDFHGFTQLISTTDTSLDGTYNSFSLNVNVMYAGDEINTGNLRRAKRITVTVTTPLGTDIQFSAYKVNY